MKKIDMHGHLGYWAFAIPNCGTAESLVHLCERYDIEHVAASSTQALTYDMRAGNEEMAEAAREHEPLLMYVYCNANWLAESCEEMDTYLAEEFGVGVKIHCGYSGVSSSDPRMYDLMAEIARRTSLVKIHPGAAEDLATWARSYPDLNIIIAHAFATNYPAAVDLAAAHPNIYLDFCCSHASRGKVAYTVERIGTAQIVFGSDMDLIDPAFVLGMFEEADLTDEQKRAVYHDNGARLLGLAQSLAERRTQG